MPNARGFPLLFLFEAAKERFASCVHLEVKAGGTVGECHRNNSAVNSAKTWEDYVELRVISDRSSLVIWFLTALNVPDLRTNLNRPIENKV